MLRTKQGDEIWCVTQPNHAAVSGYLAAHWGNDTFRSPGYFAKSPDPERLRAETILGIAEHDNGWWEWEASPQLDSDDLLPLDLRDVIRNQQDGMDRWRRGIPRLSATHPYASLLISYHAALLYAPGAGRTVTPSQWHALFNSRLPVQLEGTALTAAQSFLAEVEQLQSDIRARLADDTATAHWTEPEHLMPHVRLLQILDAASLSMCSDIIAARDGNPYVPGQGSFQFNDVPGSGWDHRVTIQVQEVSDGRIVWDPFPFDIDPLPVTVPVKIFPADGDRSQPFATWWHAQPTSALRFHLVSPDNSER